MYWRIFNNSKNSFKINELETTRISASWKSDSDILHNHNSEK